MRGTALAAALLAGCAASGQQAVAPDAPASLVLPLDTTGQPARALVERVAAGCWLDGVLRGASMIVDRRTGRVVIVSDVDDLLAADFLPPVNGHGRVRLSGPAVADPVTARRLAETLDEAVTTGRTTCPVAAG